MKITILTAFAVALAAPAFAGGMSPPITSAAPEASTRPQPRPLIREGCTIRPVYGASGAVLYWRYDVPGCAGKAGPDRRRPVEESVPAPQPQPEESKKKRRSWKSR